MDFDEPMQIRSGLRVREVPADDGLEVVRMVELLLGAVGERTEHPVRATLPVPRRTA